MNKYIQKRKLEINYCNEIIKSCWESIREIQKTCDHRWVFDKYGWQQEFQKCEECEKTRWRESPHSEIKYDTVISSIGPAVKHTDGWYY